MNLCPVWSSPAIPAYDSILQHSITLSAALGLEPGLGSHLFRTFQQAGLPAPALAADLLIGGPHSGLPDYHLLVAEAILTQARARGLGMIDQATFETLCAETKEAALREQTQFHGPCVVGAWSTIA